MITGIIAGRNVARIRRICLVAIRGSSGSGRVVGVVLTVDLAKRDSEIKILLGCSEEEIADIMSVLSSGPMRAPLVRRFAPAT